MFGGNASSTQKASEFNLVALGDSYLLLCTWCMSGLRFEPRPSIEDCSQWSRVRPSVAQMDFCYVRAPLQGKGNAATADSRRVRALPRFVGSGACEHAMKREQITRGRLRAQINVEVADGGVCIFCPTEVSERLYQHLTAKQISSLPPRRAMFSPYYPLHELVVALSVDRALAEVADFVGSLPEVCYERDVA